MAPSLCLGTHHPVYRFSNYFEHGNQRSYWHETLPRLRQWREVDKFCSHILCLCFLLLWLLLVVMMFFRLLDHLTNIWFGFLGLSDSENLPKYYLTELSIMCLFSLSCQKFSFSLWKWRQMAKLYQKYCIMTHSCKINSMPLFNVIWTGSQSSPFLVIFCKTKLPKLKRLYSLSLILLDLVFCEMGSMNGFFYFRTIIKLFLIYHPNTRQKIWY